MKKGYIYLLAAVVSIISATSADAASISLNEDISGTATYNEWITDDITIPELGFFTIDFDGARNEGYAQFILYEKQTNSYIDSEYIGENGISATYGIKAGTYEIRISSTPSSPTAPFAFTTKFAAGHTFDAEPNDNRLQAQEIPANTIIEGTTSLGAGVDLYKITAQDGQYLHVSGTKKAIYRVYNDQKQLLGLTQYGNLTVPINNGTYYIEVAGSNYEFTHSFSDAPENTEFETNNTIETATPLLLNKQVIARGNYFSDEDLYAFSVPTLGFANINLQKDSADKYDFYVYNKNEKELFHFSSAESFQMGLQPGNYYLKVIPKKSDQEEYALSLAFNGDVYPNIENNNTDEKAQLLPFNMPLRAVSPGTLGVNNVYKLHIEKEGYQVIHLKLDAPTITSLTISDGKPGLVTGNVPGEEISELIYPIGLGKGTYYVSIFTHQPIPYTIQLTTKSDYGEQEKNNIEKNASPVYFNKLMYGHFNSRRDVDYYTFTVDRTKTISWTMDPKKVKSMTVQVLDSAKNVIWEGKYHKLSGGKELKKGTYYVKATAFESGEYNLLFSDVLKDFKDVPKTHSYYQEIMDMRRLGIIMGYGDNTFKPTNPMKREHVAAMIARAEVPAIPMMLNHYAFLDVPLTHPNYTNIQKLVSGGMIDQNPNGFNPNGTITRAQMAKILVKAYALEPKTSTKIAFKDVSKVDWYYEYVQILAQYGISMGDNGYFKPNEPLTRQHFSVFLARTITK